MTAILKNSRTTALWAIATLVAAASAASFSESYRGLFIWAHDHGLVGLWAAVFPLMVDCFIAVGELALFVAMVERWDDNSRYAAWAVVGLGLAVSVLGNVGHVTSDLLSYRATAAVPPLAAAASLSVGLGVLKRIRGREDWHSGERAAQNLLQRARDAYVAGDYPAALHYLGGAEAIWPPMADELATARAAVQQAMAPVAIEEAAE